MGCGKYYEDNATAAETTQTVDLSEGSLTGLEYFAHRLS
jgi:hypothetical protein